MRKVLNEILFSFPVQLVFHHVKRNLPLIIIWIFFLAAVSGGVGKIYGIHYLFLDPEYINQVGFWSFFLVGMAFGNLAMAFNITCYILDSHRFTFVGVLEKPFAKFSVNNSFIPLLVLLIYTALIVRFQLSNEFSSTLTLGANLAGLYLGILLMLTLFSVYFRFTNKDIFKFLAGAVDKRLRKSVISRERVMNRLKETRQRKYTVTSYLDLKFRKRGCQDLQDFYDKEAILKVFDQNHFNQVVVELSIIFLIIILGSFIENPYFQIPAAASTLLMMAFVVMLIGAVTYWFRGWGLAFTFGLFLAINLLVKAGVIKGVHPARGLEYDGARAEYSLQTLSGLNSPANYDEDKTNMLATLENWKSKQKTENPKVVFMCVSGGGQRAALWTVNTLHHADSVLGGELMDRTLLITGASGGVIGAAYYRELRWRKSKGMDIPDQSEQLERIGRDNLNAIIFSLLVNDAFFRIRTTTYEDRKYTVDRGYVFEENLNKNLGGVFSKKLTDYKTPEQEAEMPMLLMSPVIANDGRKLYLSPQSMTFMNVNADGTESGLKVKGVDFNRLFADQGSADLGFLPAIRMSASFPYITPTITLPSEPRIEVMDAGISDNFGVGDAVQFILAFKEWIAANTSGVVLLTIRDTRKTSPIEPQANQSIVDRMTYPIASVYNNLASIQDINNDARIEMMQHWLEVPVELVELEYNTASYITEEYLLEAKETERKRLERASLSWHLTTREKQNIIQNIYLRNNQEALEKLGRVLE